MMIHCANAKSFDQVLRNDRDMRKRRQQIDPSRRLVSEPELMPLWPILQSLCVKDRRADPQLLMRAVVALHVCLISVREVRGGGRCKQLAAATRRALRALAAQVERARQSHPGATIDDKCGDSDLWYAAGCSC